MPSSITVSHWMSALVLCCSLSACSSSDRTKTHPVSGEVTLDGTPVKEGKIIFESSAARPASGRIVEGKILDVTTYEVGDGIPLGPHKVAVFITQAPGTAVKTKNPGENPQVDYMGGKSLIPARYNNPETSGFTAEVTPTGKNHFEFSLLSR